MGSAPLQEKPDDSVHITRKAAAHSSSTRNPGNRLHPVLAAVYLQASHIAQDTSSYPPFICLLYITPSQPGNVAFDRQPIFVESDH